MLYMPAKNIFDRKKIIEAAFEIVRKEGWNKLSARSIARKMGCSTMPVYSYLKSMEELKNDLKERTVALLLDYQTRDMDKDHPFLDMGMGYLLFARNEKNLFKFLYEEKSGNCSFKKQLEEKKFGEMYKVMHDDPLLKDFSQEQLKDVLLKMWIFVHGLSFMMIYREIDDIENKDIKRLIMETGISVINEEERRSKIISVKRTGVKK